LARCVKQLKKKPVEVDRFHLKAAASEPRGLQGTAIEAATLSSIEAVKASLNFPTAAKQVDKEME
jgi:hypothetical protein